MNQMTPLMMLLISGCAMRKMEVSKESTRESNEDHTAEKDPAPFDVAPAPKRTILQFDSVDEGALTSHPIQEGRLHKEIGTESLERNEHFILGHQDEYTDHGVNPFVNAITDHLSTFSVDVDTASYTQARRRIKEGRLPDLASVRVEEFVNYFDYQYDSTDAEPFIVHMEGMSDPFRDGQHILRVGVQGKRPTQKERPALRLTFLVDISGSMSAPDKLPLAQKSMHMLVDSLRDDDSVSLVTYAGAVRKILPPTYGDSKDAIHRAIDRLTAGGSTAMSSGLELAYEQAWESFKDGAENRVVILSDGDANVGHTSWESMLDQIKSYADRGVTVSTIGLGMGNYKDTRMEQLANKGDGNNFYIDSQEEAKKVFVDGFLGTMITIARDVKIQLDFNSDTVHSYRLIGYENRDIADENFRNDRVDAGEVGAGHSVTALYALKLNEPSSMDTIATARLRYETPGADKAAQERAFLFRAEQIRETPSSQLSLAYTAASFAEKLRRSPFSQSYTLSQLEVYGRTQISKKDRYTNELVSLIALSNTLKDEL